jgi:sulfonate transport system substrate-binding protein
VKLTGKWASEHQKEVSTLLTQQTGVPADIVATWMQRSRFGATPVTPDIVANQQRVADLFYQQKLIPKAVNIASRVWTWQPK